MVHYLKLNYSKRLFNYALLVLFGNDLATYLYIQMNIDDKSFIYFEQSE